MKMWLGAPCHQTFIPLFLEHVCLLNSMKGTLKTSMDTRSFTLLELPDAAVLHVLRHLDARSLAMLELAGSRDYLCRREPTSRLPLLEAVAREAVRSLCGPQADRFRYNHAHMHAGPTAAARIALPLAPQAPSAAQLVASVCRPPCPAAELGLTAPIACDAALHPEICAAHST
jgi:hypothetical protein